jgi:hypothetical protein
MQTLMPTIRPTMLVPGIGGFTIGSRLWDVAGFRPSLDLQLATTKSLVDATTGSNLVTFTRASSGTFVGSDGLIKTAVTNLLLRSQELNSASWSKVTQGTGSTPVVTENYAVAPDGSFTANRLQASRGAGNAGGDQSSVNQSVSGLPDPHTITISIWAKSNTGSNQSVYFRNATGDGGSVITVTNEWQRFFFSATRSGATTNSLQIGSRGTLNTTNSVDILVWGAQLEQSSTVGEYIPTTSTINSAPRFDHNPVTGESLGLLVEEQRTNLLVRSEEFDNASWSKVRSSITANTIVAPDGTLTADKIVEDTSASATHAVTQSIIQAANTTSTFSVNAKAAERSFVNLRITVDGVNFIRCGFDLSNGTAGTPENGGNGSGAVASIQSVGNGWYRCAISGIQSSTNSNPQAQIFIATGTTTASAPYTGDGTSGIYLWGAQLEVGAFPTSYIPTTTAAVTRSADVASISGSNFSSWYRADEGTAFVEGQRFTTGSSILFSIDDGTSVNRQSIIYNTNTQIGYRSITGSTTDVTLNLTVLGSPARSRAAGSYALNNFTFSANGAAPIIDASAAVPLVNQMSIGSQIVGTSGYLNGTIRRLTYWPTRLPDSTLQAVTQ